jgi:hypothetical protein
LIVASAMEGNCGVLFSEDFLDMQQIGNVTISNSFARQKDIFCEFPSNGQVKNGAEGKSSKPFGI